MTLAEKLRQVQERIEAARQRAGSDHPVEIVAVTKTHPAARIVDIYQAGLRAIGENRVQEAAEKFPLLPSLPGLRKRLVGHLQSNKINKALDLFDTLDALDTLRLAEKTAVRAQKRGRPLPVLLEVNTSGETTKYGFEPENIQDLLACCELEGLAVQGLMTLGPFTPEKALVCRAFRRLFRLRETLNGQLPARRQLEVLSMGMSSDFELAVEEGSTMVRLGTVLFGPRRY